MTTFNLVNTLTIEAFVSEFKSNFGATLNIYNGSKLADMSATLKDVGLTKESKFECRSCLTVASFIKKMNEEFGIYVKVFTCDGWVAVLDGLTLESAGKVKKQATKADMESMIVSQHESGCDEGHISVIREIINLIREERMESSLYTSDKNAITAIFDTIPDKYSYNSILVKLTIIDSLYSTQMGRRYYGLDELAKVLFELHSHYNLAERFLLLASGNLSSVDFPIYGGKSNLFEEAYGIGKDGSEKGKAISLITKYAYFETKGNFPIYDSIAREMYPKIWAYCGFDKKKCPNQTSLLELETFIAAINEFKSWIAINDLTYDDIDRLLWTTGKIVRGNLSLVLTREEYDYMADHELLGENGFDIKNVEISHLPFLNEKQLLKALFGLAQELS